MEQLAVLFIALFLGYKLKHLPVSDSFLNKILFFIVIAILMVMGYEFGAHTDNLWLELIAVGKMVFVFGGLIFIFNLGSISLILKKQNQDLHHENHKLVQANYIKFILESGKYIVIIAFGIVLGILIHKPLHMMAMIINLLLVILLFVIGHQMRKNDVSLREVIFNKTGFILAITVAISSLIAGAIAALVLHLPIVNGVLLSSGFGWYTLSSILVGQFIGQDYGTTVFFIDFLRELIAIILLPSLGRYIPLSMVGYCGATAMDFSLPIIKQNLDEKCIIVAISSGMILSLLTPLIIPLLAHI